jgi:hypothetical protein
LAKNLRSVHVVLHEGEFIVVPAAMVMVGGDTLKIVNHTDEDLTWIVPDGALVGSPNGKNTHSERINKKSGAAHAGTDVGSGPGVYRYKILVGDTGKEAKGHSDPMIIIDPNP